MGSWIDFAALGKILGVGLLAGAGLPALFAMGLRLLPVPSGVTSVREPKVSGQPTRLALAATCFAVVLAAIAYGIYLIVTG